MIKITKLKKQVENIVSKDNSEALSNSVWLVTTAFSPWTLNKKTSYLADIQNFLDWKTLQQLIDVKADWATFGALSNEELKMLQNSASTFNQLAVRDKDTQQIISFKGSESNFKNKVNEIINEYKLLIEKKNKN